MRAATCFSGIGAPECAAPWLDWRWCAEIEPFPAAVHAHRFPGVVNLGDVLAPDFLDRAEQVDVLVGGPPCQSFSTAGLRGGLADPRGNLTLRWVQVIHAVRPRYAVTENVPGWLSSNDNAFGCFLAGLVGADDPLRTPDGRSWPDAGMAAGPLGRAAWRVLDAQHFALAQRRRRVFVVFCPPDGGDPAAVLFERQGVRRHPAPGRDAGEDVARPLASGTRSSGGYRNDADTAENLIAHALRSEGFDASEDGTGRGTPLVAGTIDAAMGRGRGAGTNPGALAIAYGGNKQTGPIDVATARNAHAVPHGRLDFESETFVVQPTAYRVTGNDGAYSTGDAVGALGTMTDPSAQVIVFEAKRAGQSSDLAPTLRAMGHAESHPNAGAYSTGDAVGALGTMTDPTAQVVAMATDGHGSVSINHHATGTLTAQQPSETSARQFGVSTESGVRRLLPVECERLQGFPEVSGKVIISVCADETKCPPHAAVEVSCTTGQDSVSRADESALRQRVLPVDRHSSASHLGHAPPVLLHVLLNYERRQVAISNRERCLWSANIAETPSSSPLSMQIAGFARLVARMAQIAARATPHGREASRQDTGRSTHQWSGEAHVNLSGDEIAGHADAVRRFIETGADPSTFTTSPRMSSTQNLGLTLEIWSCCVLSAIASFIPPRTLSDCSFAIEVEARGGWTDIVHRGKPAADGPRYKAIGNSMAVPVLAWLLDRVRADALRTRAAA